MLPSNVPDEITGLSTGVVFRVTRTNEEILTATIGNPTPDGNRYAVLSNLESYIFIIPAHTAANMTRTRAEFVKPAETSGVVSEPVFIEGDEADDDDDEVETIEENDEVENP